jgi:hypothetical protein
VTARAGLVCSTAVNVAVNGIAKLLRMMIEEDD